jgi:hypothetical protein
VRIDTNDPSVVTASILAGLDSHAANLRGLTVSQPSLETAFLQLTQDLTETAIEEQINVA